MLYSELQCSEAIHNAVERMGFAEMTEIQEKTIPLMLAGHDVIAQDPDLSSHFFHVNILDFYTNIVIIFKNAYCRIILANTNK